MSLAKKLIYPKNLKRIILVLLLATAVATITMGAVFDAAHKHVNLTQIDELLGINNTKEYSTRKSTIGEFLQENQIEIGEYDIINKGIDELITEDDTIIIRKGRQIELAADGTVEFAITTKANVGEALLELGITLSEEDVVTPGVDEMISNGMSIVIDRYTTQTVTETETIAFKTKKINKSSILSGKTKVAISGKEGIKEITYTVKMKNGEVVSKEFASEKVIKEPVDKVVYVGTGKQSKTSNSSVSSSKSSSSSSKGFSYSKKFNVTATAYSKSLSENGGNAKTAYGLTPQVGVVAVDPKVIPLGTKLYIESSDGGKSWTYGYCIAGDTGGAIKGNKVDLCFNTNRECVKFGRKSATVYILN